MKFVSSMYTGAGANYARCVELSVWQTHTGDNTSALNWEAWIGSSSSSTTAILYAHYVEIILDNKKYVLINGSTPTRKKQLIGCTEQFADDNPSYPVFSDQTVQHDSHGKKTVSVEINARFYNKSGAFNSTYKGEMPLVARDIYSLSVKHDERSSVLVERTYTAGFGINQALTPGVQGLNYGDKIKVSFGVSDSRYKLDKHTVNGNNFTSGYTYTVLGNVSIIASTKLKASASSVSAQDAYIGRSCPIKIIPGEGEGLRHTLSYDFPTGSTSSETGTIVDNVLAGTYTWNVPDSLYKKIPNDPSGVCKIICSTWDSSGNWVGNESCNIKLHADPISVSPGISFPSDNIKDINRTTFGLSRDNKVLIKGFSTAECSVAPIAAGYASLKTVSLDNGSYHSEQKADGKVTYSFVVNNVSSDTFLFKVTDSREFSESKSTKARYFINYFTPSIYPSLRWDYIKNGDTEKPTININFNGNAYLAKFGGSEAVLNTISVYYSYKKKSASTWSSEANIPVSVSGNSFRATNPVSIEVPEDYFDYDIKFRMTDRLQTVTKSFVLKGRYPIFDWGKEDFNFNVKTTHTKDVEIQDGGLLKAPNFYNVNPKTPGYFGQHGYVFSNLGNCYGESNTNDKYYLAARSDGLIGIGTQLSSNGVGATDITWNYADTVAAEGESGKWYYRKYLSGWAECWTLKMMVEHSTISSGQLFGGYTRSTDIPLPIGFLSQEAIVLGTGHLGTGMGFIDAYPIENAKIRVHCIGNQNSDDMKLSLFVIGRWK